MGRLFPKSISQMMTASTQRAYARCVCWLLAAALGATSFTRLSWGASVEDVALMKSPDRQKILIEGAKKEGKVIVLHRADCRSGGAPTQRRF